MKYNHRRGSYTLSEIELFPVAAVASSYTWGAIGSAVVTFAKWGWHNEDYVDKVQPLKNHLLQLRSSESAPQNQSDKIILKLAHKERAVQQQVHQAEVQLGPNQNFNDFVDRTGNYGTDLLGGVIGVTAVASIVAGAFYIKDGWRQKFAGQD